MAKDTQENINYFTFKNAYFSGAVDLTVVREELQPTGIIIPKGIALLELENHVHPEIILPEGLVLPTDLETQKILATREYKEDDVQDTQEEGEHYLEAIGDIDSLHDVLVEFVSHAIRSQNQVTVSLNASIRADEKACMERVGYTVRRIQGGVGVSGNGDAH